MNILVTGGQGFIGSNFVAEWRYGGKCIILDAMTYAANDFVPGKGVLIKGNINDFGLVRNLIAEYEIDAIVHFAAESHVDRSILSAAAFIESNVSGTHTLLEVVRRSSRKIRFLHVSTDEVYGTLTPYEAPFTEESPYAPNNPYAASKAASDHFVRAYSKTYGLETLITHCTNNYGPIQHTEKFIPQAITNCLNGKPIPVYGTGANVRDWIYVSDHCSALRKVLWDGTPGETYNIGARTEKTNLEVAALIARKLGGTLTFVDDRLGHDLRYSIDPSKIIALGWLGPEVGFENGIDKTIAYWKERAATKGL
jgi:dTDP-glucose 4,6-dehydratase